MGKRSSRFKERMASSLELPGDLAFSEPVLTVVGQREICIENYRRILEYTETRLQLLTRRGRLAVEGEGLRILYYRGEEMKIGGRIRRILFEDP